MDAELVTLASSGASTLVTLMVMDGWAEAKEKFARLLGRKRGDAQTVAEELEGARTQLAQANEEGDGEVAADVTAEWRSRLRRMLQEDPQAAPLLAELIEQYVPEVGRVSASTDIHHNAFQGPTALHTGSGGQTNTFGAPAS